jgi:hypothetical protein
MLHATLSNKPGRTTSFTEDSLTSSVFGHLFYLPLELAWEIIREAVFDHDLPRHCGDLESYEFWPKWDGKGTANSNSVEPDVFLRFSEFDMIIEAKRWEVGMQSSTQWKNQIIAYRNEYQDDSKSLFYVAIGGIHGEGRQSLEINGVPCTIAMCQWSRVLRATKQVQRQLERSSYRTSASDAHLRTLRDIASLFGLHGFATGDWLENINVSRFKLSVSPRTDLLRFQTHSPSQAS